ncbi:MAG: hypothetical protein ACTSSP_07435 [Candidatus Asgardarchaeia archaeon]|nr:hypothetical protein [Candidatus Odinarchaeota archaeon]
MKLYEIAARAIKILQESGPEGIHSNELIQKLGIPRRRIYDIIAVFSAANLIKVKREKGGSRLYWMESLPEPSKKISQLVDLVEKLKEEKETLTLKIAQLQQELESVRKGITVEAIKETKFERIKLPVKKVEIRAEVPHRITRVYSTGIGAIVESDGEGLIIIPELKKNKKTEVVVE